MKPNHILAVSLLGAAVSTSLPAQNEIRLRDFVGGQEVVNNPDTITIGVPVTVMVELRFDVPLEGFRINTAASSSLTLVDDPDPTPELLAYNPEFLRVERNGDSATRAVMVADFQEPFEGRTLPANAPDYLPCYTYSLTSTTAQEGLNGTFGSGEFVINGGQALVPSVQDEVAFYNFSGFIRGEVNGDGAVSLADAVRVIYHMYVDSVAYPIACLDAADVNDDGMIDIADPFSIILVIFGEFVIPPPGPPGGGDPTPDPLPCDRPV